MPKKKISKNFNRLDKLEVEYVALESIKPNDYNPNRQTEQMLSQLMRSIEEDGFIVPIIVQRDTKEIVDGEHRYLAAQRLNMTKVPVVFVNMTKEQMMIATLRHNRTRGSEVIELTSEVMKELNQLNAIGWVHEALNMDKAETDRLLSLASAAEALAKGTFNQAWEPVKTEDVGEGTHVQTDEYNRSHAGTKSEENKTEFRLALMFFGEDAQIVKAFFKGKNAASTILEWVKANCPEPTESQ